MPLTLKDGWETEEISVKHDLVSREARDVFREVAGRAIEKLTKVFEARFSDDGAFDITEVVLLKNPEDFSYFFRKDDMEKDEPFFGQSPTYTTTIHNALLGVDESHVCVKVAWRTENESK